MSNDRIAAAAKMAGDWWAERLDGAHADKREAFRAAVVRACESGLRERGWWSSEVDYDPQGEMLAIVRETIHPTCAGVLYSARGILPMKHSLKVRPGKLEPKEGYGNWTAEIPVPASAPEARAEGHARDERHDDPEQGRT